MRLKYKDGESIVVHINTFMGLVYQLAVAMFPLHDAMQALLLECTLQDSWENQVVSLSTSCQEENSSLQVVKTSILNEETRRTDKGDQSQSEANMALNLDIGRSKQRSPQKRESLMLCPTEEETSHNSIVENLNNSRKTVNTLRNGKLPQTMLNLEGFRRRLALQSWLQVEKIFGSFVSDRGI